MNALNRLIDCAGEWPGTNQLYLGPDAPADESASQIKVIPLLGGRFVRLDQAWAHDGSAQEGSLLLGFDPETKSVSLHWVDTFHMGHKVMTCTGMVERDGRLNVRGSYAAPPGPDWGWRIVIRAEAGKRIEMEMFNIEPGGEEMVAVRATYAR